MTETSSLIADAQQGECSGCGVQLNIDGTVDEMDPANPEGHYADCAR